VENLSSEAITSSPAELGEISALKDLVESYFSQAKCSKRDIPNSLIKIVERIAMELCER
jgi:hypothetical protein